MQLFHQQRRPIWLRRLLLFVLLPLGICGMCIGGMYLQQFWPVRIPQMEPAPREVASPEELPPDLREQHIMLNRDGQRVFMDLEGRVNQELTQIINERTLSTTYVISPSEQLIAYDTIFSLVLWDLTTHEETVLVRKEDFNAISVSQPAFTPDEHEIFFSVGWPDRGRLAVVGVDSSAPRIVVPGGNWPVVSPNGRWVLHNNGLPRLYLYDRQTGSNSQLTELFTESGELSGWHRGVFSADSRYIVYEHFVKIGDPVGLYRMNLDGGEKVQLANDIRGAVILATQDEAVFTCPDAESFSCTWVCVINLDGTDPRRLTYLGKSCSQEENE